MKQKRSLIAAALCGLLAASAIVASIPTAIAQDPNEIVTMCGNNRTIQVRRIYREFFLSRGYTDGACQVTPVNPV